MAWRVAFADGPLQGQEDRLFSGAAVQTKPWRWMWFRQSHGWWLLVAAGPGDPPRSGRWWEGIVEYIRSEHESMLEPPELAGGLMQGTAVFRVARADHQTAEPVQMRGTPRQRLKVLAGI